MAKNEHAPDPEPTAAAAPTPDETDAEEEPVKGALRDNFETILVSVLIVLFSKTFVFQQSKIPTGSMEDTLLIGDHIMVNKYVYGPTASAWERAVFPVREIQAGDVVVFKSPEDPSIDFIKRVVAVGGQRVEMRNRQLYVDGEAVDEPYKVHKIPRKGGRPLSYIPHADDFGPVLIPEGHYFCMGDNRDRSNDSRAWGAVPREFIKGRAFIIWWSFPQESDSNPHFSLQRTARNLARVAISFFTATRWNRTFQVIQ